MKKLTNNIILNIINLINYTIIIIGIFPLEFAKDNITR